ncbi:unnamed protein product [Schistosoma mattheei]|uniref:Uncharacterized protein n=1 Tax=Schistosoma mattheei TaxID=31246 RepID=A0A183PV85_9TREM|nr:unnamed protein product [Schistosoma mattheei]
MIFIICCFLGGKPGTNKFPTDRRATLTLEDLIASLNDRGIHVAKPPYYR